MYLNNTHQNMLLVCFLIFSVVITSTGFSKESDWLQYGGDEGGSRYSKLNQINTLNVKDLEVAWTYKTGHLDRVPEQLSFLRKLVGFQVTPIILPDDVGGNLVFCTPFNEVIALNGAYRGFHSYTFYNPILKRK